MTVAVGEKKAVPVSEVPREDIVDPVGYVLGLPPGILQIVGTNLHQVGEVLIELGFKAPGKVVAFGNKTQSNS